MLNEFIVERSVLNVHVTGTDDEYGQDFTASLSYVGLIDGHDQEALYEMDSRETPGGMFGYPANQASPSFNLPLNGNCEVEIVPLNGGSNRMEADHVRGHFGCGRNLYRLRLHGYEAFLNA